MQINKGQARWSFAIRKCHDGSPIDPNITFGSVIPWKHWRKSSTEQLKDLISVVKNCMALDMTNDRRTFIVTTKSSAGTRSIFANCYKISEIKVKKKHINGLEVKGLVDMSLDITVILPKS